MDGTFQFCRATGTEKIAYSMPFVRGRKIGSIQIARILESRSEREMRVRS
jgi:hypothetical protein